MRNYNVIFEDNVIQVGTAVVIREYLETRFAEKFEFLPMLQESEDEGYLEVYLHTDSYDDLEDEDIAKLEELGISESDSLHAICSLFEIRVEPVETSNKRYTAVYSFGGIVDSIEEGTDLREMAKEMRAYLDEQGFDSEKDDARIFQVNGGFSKVVYSYQTRETLLENDDIEVYRPLDGTIKTFGRNTKDDMIVFYDPEQNFGHQ